MFELALWIVAFIVYLRLVLKKDAWGWIVLYWAVLCVKNAGEMSGGIF